MSYRATSQRQVRKSVASGPANWTNPRTFVLGFRLASQQAAEEPGPLPTMSAATFILDLPERGVSAGCAPQPHQYVPIPDLGRLLGAPERVHHQEPIKGTRYWICQLRVADVRVGLFSWTICYRATRNTSTRMMAAEGAEFRPNGNSRRRWSVCVDGKASQVTISALVDLEERVPTE